MRKYRVLLSGSGGQGIITMALVLAEAAAIYDGLVAVQSQVYGPEARGGATRSDVIIAETDIYFPKVTQPGILVTLNQASFNKFNTLVRPGGLVLTDSTLVNPSSKLDAALVSLPFHEVALSKFGRSQSLNICVFGALVGITGIVRVDSAEKALEARFPNAIAVNRKAFEVGFEMGVGKKDII